MNKRRKKIVTIVTVLCLCLLAGIRTLAADGSITYGSSSYSATQGETFQVGVYVNGSEAIGAYEFYLDYSADMLEYVSGADGGGSGRLKFVGNGNSESYKYMLTFKAKTAGNTTISISNVYLGPLNLSSGDSMNITTAASAPITIQGPSSASGECRLKSLNISPTGLWDQFAPDKTEYDITVDNDVEKLTISAEPENSKASVQVSDTNLKVGVNTIKVTVNAENGETKSYNIIVRRKEGQNQTQQTEAQTTVASTTAAQEPTETTQAQQPATVPNIEGLDTTRPVSVNGKELYFKEDMSAIQPPEGFSATTVNYKGQETPAFISADNIVLFYLIDGIEEKGAFYVYESEQENVYPYIKVTNKSGNYLVLSADNTVQAPAGYTATVLSLGSEGENIETNVTAWVNEANSEFFLLYARNENGEKNFYQYDQKERTLQRYAGNSISQDGETNNPSDTSLQEELNKLKLEQQKDTKSKLMIIIILSCLCVILIILVITLIFRLRGQTDNDDIGTSELYLKKEETAATEEIITEDTNRKEKKKRKRKEKISDEEEIEEDEEELIEDRTDIGIVEERVSKNRIPERISNKKERIDTNSIEDTKEIEGVRERLKEAKEKKIEPVDTYSLQEDKKKERKAKREEEPEMDDFLVDLDDDDFTFFDYDDEDENDEL